MIAKNYLNILVEQLFLHFFNDLSSAAVVAFPKILDLYLKDVELFVATLIGFLASCLGIQLFKTAVNFQMHLNNYHYIQSNCT